MQIPGWIWNANFFLGKLMRKIVFGLLVLDGMITGVLNKMSKCPSHLKIRTSINVFLANRQVGCINNAQMSQQILHDSTAA